MGSNRLTTQRAATHTHPFISSEARMEFETLKYEKNEAGYAVVTFNRP